MEVKKADKILCPHGLITHISNFFGKDSDYFPSKQIYWDQVRKEINVLQKSLNNDFFPNYYVSLNKKDIQKKISALKIYKSEMGKFPFPRSKESIFSLAKFRGTTINSEFAEAFVLKKFID